MKVFEITLSLSSSYKNSYHVVMENITDGVTRFYFRSSHESVLLTWK